MGIGSSDYIIVNCTIAMHGLGVGLGLEIGTITIVIHNIDNDSSSPGTSSTPSP